MTATDTSDTKGACRFCSLCGAHNRAVFDAPVSESQSHFAIASIGGFVPGWTLVCPKDHVLNLGKLYQTPELLEFSDHIARALWRIHNRRVVVFEHGARASGSLTGCGTNHAHLHLVPFGQSLREAVRRFDPNRGWIEAPAQDVDAFVGNLEYLLMAESVEALNTAAYICGVQSPQSQYFRRAIAHALQQEHLSNYRTHPFFELAIRTASRLRAEFETQPASLLPGVA